MDRVFIVDPTFEPGQVEPLTSQSEPVPSEIFRAMMVESIRRLEWQLAKALEDIRELSEVLTREMS